MFSGESAWIRAAEQVAGEVLSASGYTGGVVDALRLARQLGYTVVFDQQQSTRGRLKRMGGRVSIFLRPDPRPERIQWALCHEIGETLAHRVFGALEESPTTVTPGLREQVANLLATRLLLPLADFRTSVERCACDLAELKQIYWTASHELIALRLLDIPLPVCVTIVDQGRITKRRSAHAPRCGPWIPVEQTCWQFTHENSQFHESHDPPYHVRCWPIHESHWKREILLCTSAADPAD